MLSLPFYLSFSLSAAHRLVAAQDVDPVLQGDLPPYGSDNTGTWDTILTLDRVLEVPPLLWAGRHGVLIWNNGSNYPPQLTKGSASWAKTAVEAANLTYQSLLLSVTNAAVAASLPVSLRVLATHPHAHAALVVQEVRRRERVELGRSEVAAREVLRLRSEVNPEKCALCRSQYQSTGGFASAEVKCRSFCKPPPPPPPPETALSHAVAHVATGHDYTIVYESSSVVKEPVPFTCSGRQSCPPFQVRVVVAATGGDISLLVE